MTPSASSKRVQIVVNTLLNGCADSSQAVRLCALKSLSEIYRRHPRHRNLSANALVKILDHSDAELRLSAADCLLNDFSRVSQVAPNSIPSLISALQNGESRVRRCSARFLRQARKHLGKEDTKRVVEGLQKLLQVGDRDAKAEAILSLGQFGDAATPALKSLFHCLLNKDSTLALHACQSLKELAAFINAPEAQKLAPSILAPLKAGETELLYSRLELLGELILKLSPEQKRDTVAKLLSLSHAGDFKLQDLVIHTLSKLGVDAVPWLLKGLKDPHPNTRYMAVVILERLGAGSEAAIPALIDALQDKDIDVRYAVVNALGELGAVLSKKTAHKIAYVLHENLKTCQHWNEKCHSLRALGKILNKHSLKFAAEVASTFCQSLSDKDETVRATAAKALGQVRISSKNVVSKLIRSLQDPSSEVRIAVAEALGHIGHDGKSSTATDILNALVGRLNDRENVYAYVNAIGLMGKQALSALPVLTKQLNDVDFEIRYHAAEALGRVIGRNKAKHEGAALKALLVCLNDKYWIVQARAAEALGHMGPRAARAIPLLNKLLKSPFAELRWSAAFALGEMGTLAKLALPRLRETLRDKHPEARRLAAEAIRKIEKE